MWLVGRCLIISGDCAELAPNLLRHRDTRLICFAGVLYLAMMRYLWIFLLFSCIYVFTVHIESDVFILAIFLRSLSGETIFVLYLLGFDVEYIYIGIKFHRYIHCILNTSQYFMALR